MLFCEPSMQSDGGPQIHLMAFVERPAEKKSGPALLQVYIANESPSPLGILNDLDSINIPQHLPHGSEPIPDADLIHLDFGVSGSGAFIQVSPGACLKVTLVLRAEQLALLERVKFMKAAVRFRAGSDKTSEVKTALLPATVYVVHQH